MQIVTNQDQKELKRHGSDSFPFLVSYEKQSNYESGFFQWHWHPEIEITYIKKGQMIYQVNQFSYHLKEGDILFENSNVLHAGSMDEEDCEYISITFSPKLIAGFSHSLIETKYVESITHNFSMSALLIDGSQNWHADFKMLIGELIELDAKRASMYELDIVIHLQSLWKLLASNAVSTAEAPAHDQADYQRIKNILTFIEQHYMDSFSLLDIADHVGLCESECSRLFKRYMKTPLFAFIQEYRIEKSLELLNGEDSLIIIAEKCGFSDSNYYSKVFKKVKGVSPREYRKTFL